MNVKWSNVAALALCAAMLWLWKQPTNGPGVFVVAPRPWNSETYKLAWYCATLIAIIAVVKLIGKKSSGRTP